MNVLNWHRAAMTACVMSNVVLLTACGGGGDAGTDASLSGARSQSAAVPIVNSNDEILIVRPAGDAEGNQITLSWSTTCTTTTTTWSWWYWRNITTTTTSPCDQPLTVNADGNGRYSIDALPAALAAHPRPTTGTWGHRRVRFAPGTYRLKQGWDWTEATTGSDASHQLILERYTADGTTTSIDSVKIFGSWSPSTVTTVGVERRVSLPTGFPRFSQVWAEGQMAVRARTPDVGGFHYIQAGVTRWKDGSSTAPRALNIYTDTLAVPQTSYVGSRDERTQFVDDLMAHRAFEVYPEFMAELQRAKATTGALLVTPFTWSIGMHRLDELDVERYRAKVSPALSMKFAEFGPGQRYFLENYPEALTSAREWYATSTELRYIPFNTSLTATNLAKTIEVPRVRTLLRMRHSSASLAADLSKQPRYVVFSGLTFGHASAYIPDGGYNEIQAAHQVEAAIDINDANNITFDGCRIAHVGGYGIWLNRRASKVSLVGNEIVGTGAGGIKIGLAQSNFTSDISAEEAATMLLTKGNLIERNHIHATGAVFPGAIGIWVGHASGNTIRNNLIQDTTNSGISLGWAWASDKTLPSGAELSARGNVVESNFLLNIGQRAGNDHGGIYTLGRLTATKITGNVIREVRTHADYGNALGANGIYLDMGSSDLEIQGNFVLGADGSAIAFAAGQTNLVKSNVLANAPIMLDAGYVDVANMKMAAMTLDGNYLLPSAAQGFITGVAAADVWGRPPLIEWQGGNPVAWREYQGADGTQKRHVDFLGAAGVNRLGGQFANVSSIGVPALCNNCTAASLAVTANASLALPKLSVGGTQVNTGVTAQSWVDTASYLNQAVAASPSLRWQRAATWPKAPKRFVNFDAQMFAVGDSNPAPFKEYGATDMTVMNDGAGTQRCARFGAGNEHYVDVDYDSGKATARATLQVPAGTRVYWRIGDGGGVAQGGALTRAVILELDATGASGVKVRARANDDIILREVGTLPMAGGDVSIALGFDLASTLNASGVRELINKTISLSISGGGLAQPLVDSLALLNSNWTQLRQTSLAGVGGNASDLSTWPCVKLYQLSNASQ
jgi:Right handed beta helix region